MPMTPEVRAKWTEAWAEARKLKDQRRKENREEWAKRRDWSDDNEHKTSAGADDNTGGAPGSLEQMRRIMLDGGVALYRRLDAAEVVLAYELGPAAAVGLDPEQIAASSYKFLKEVTQTPETPEALRFRALRSLVGIENARAAAKSGAESQIEKRLLVVALANAERLRLLRAAGRWPELANDDGCGRMMTFRGRIANGPVFGHGRQPRSVRNWRPTRRVFALQADLDAWLVEYN